MMSGEENLPPIDEEEEEDDYPGRSVSVNEVESNYVSKTSCFRKLRFVTVEPVLFGSVVIIVMYTIMQQEYIFSAFAESYGLKNQTKKECNQSFSNKSDPEHEIAEKVSQETSNWILYLNVTGFTITTFTTLFYGAWSDKVGRKMPLFISLFGLFCLATVYLIVVNFGLPVPVLLVGHILCSLCGDFSTVLTCCFAHLSDVSSGGKRTFRLAIGEACIGLGALFASLCGGYWVRARGFDGPFWFLFGVGLANLLYVACCVTSVNVSQQRTAALKDFFTVQPILNVYRMIRHGHGTRRNIRILLYTFCIFLVMCVMVGVQFVLVVFEIGVPFCWNTTQVGFSSALLQGGYLVCLVLMKIFPSSKSELWLVILDIVSNILMSLILTFATLSWHIYLGVAMKTFGYMSVPVIRSHVSRSVDKNEVGSVFSLLSVARCIASLIAVFLYNGIFNITVTWKYTGAVFSIGCILYTMHAISFSVAYRMSKNYLNEEAAQGDYHQIQRTS